MTAALAAILFGLLAGLRTFTAPAILWLVRRGTPLAYVLGVLALLEYAGDLSPRVPARTQPFGLIARACSGAFCGWTVAGLNAGSPVLCAVLGALAAIGGAYAGLALRRRLAALAGRVPAALIEDAFTIACSVALALAA